MATWSAVNDFIGKMDHMMVYATTLTFTTTATTTTPATYTLPFANVKFVFFGDRVFTGDIFTCHWTASGDVITPTRVVETAGTLAQATVDMLVLGF